MGVFDFLVGGSESKTKTKDATPPELQALRSPFADVIKSLFGGNGEAANLTGIPQYGGPLTAEMTDGERAALAQFSTDDPLQVQRRDLLTKTMRGDFVGSNPFLQAAIEAAQRPTFQGLEEVLSRTLPGRFTQAGQFVQPQGSSAFDRAAAIASRGAAQEAGDIAAKISAGAYEGERGRQQESIQLGQQEVQTLVANLQAQALPRLIQQHGIELGLEEFKSRITALLQALGIAQGSLVNLGQQSKTSESKGLLPAIGSIVSLGVSR
jgi:hypothetical protein